MSFLYFSKFPITGTFPKPGTCSLAFDTSFDLIPPITTISPSAINSFVIISILEIGGSFSDTSASSLFTWISNKTFPSPIILGVTCNFSAASLNEVEVVPSDVVS